MSLTLGEKLRQAREERGFTISEVAEQTRISSLYLESIENDDYRILPGGIFNKGFVKSYAKFVGINEGEALVDYAEIISQTTTDDELKLYKPEVLTDDRSMSSMLPTIILAVVILGIMTAGILFLVDYMKQPDVTAGSNVAPAANSNTVPETDSDTNPSPAIAPVMASLKVEFKALSVPVSLTATSDGKTSNNIVTAGTAATFEPRESLKLSYSRSLANSVQLTINGKSISLPAQPLTPRRNAIEFEINQENLGEIWTSGAISSDGPSAEPTINSVAETLPINTPAVTTPVATPPKPTPAPKPTAAANNTARSTPVKPPANTPVTMQSKPVVNKP